MLEVAIGTGQNLEHYPPDCDVTGIDLSHEMLARAKARADRLGRKLKLEVMDAQSLVFPDASFDTVVDSLSLCTFPAPIQALCEMGRVCSRDGQLLFLEHGRSDRHWLGQFQDRRADRHAAKLGCVWNREPLELVEQAGLNVLDARRYGFGMFHVIVARP